MKGERGENLIFLISQPRAGSTLLQLMLSGHPEIATTGEPWISLHPLYALRETGVEAEYDSGSARAALMDFLRQLGKDEEFYRRRTADFLMSFYRLAAERENKPRFLDKTPRYYYIVPELMETFPEARFIILLRNPLAVLNSILKTWVKDKLGFLGWHRDDLLTAPRNLVDCLKRFPDRSIRVSYEELVSEPEKILKEICSFLGLDYSPDMIEYGDRADQGWKFGDPVGVQRSSRPTAASLDSWKKGLSSPQHALLAEEYLERLGPALIRELGYDPGALASAISAPRGRERDGLETWDSAMKYGVSKTEIAIKSSLSWRITAPLRAFGRLLGR